MTDDQSLNDSLIKNFIFSYDKEYNIGKLMQILFLFLYFQLVQETESRNRYYLAPLVTDYRERIIDSDSYWWCNRRVLVFAYCYEVFSFELVWSLVMRTRIIMNNPTKDLRMYKRTNEPRFNNGLLITAKPFGERTLKFFGILNIIDRSKVDLESLIWKSCQ